MFPPAVRIPSQEGGAGKKFCNVVRRCYTIPDEFVEMNLLRLPGKNLMNKLMDAVLTLYNYDDDPDNTDVYQTLVKGVNLLAKLPSIACYAYQSKVHYYDRESLFIHYANPEYSIAENFLSLLRQDQKSQQKKQAFSIPYSCFMRTMAAAITPPLPML